MNEIAKHVGTVQRDVVGRDRDRITEIEITEI